MPLDNFVVRPQRQVVERYREAAMAAFSDFIQGATVTPDQLEFIHLIVEELTQNGVMAPERLFQSPYTDVHERGPLGIFPPARVTQMLGVLEGIRARAA
jgi:type I restriction enzyme R subunit